MGLHTRCVSLLVMASGGVSIHAHWDALTRQRDMLRKVTDGTIGAPWSGLVAAEGANSLATLGHALVAPSLATCVATGAFVLAWSRAYDHTKAVGDFWLLLTVATSLTGTICRLVGGEGAGLVSGATALGTSLAIHGGLRNIEALRLLTVQTLVLSTLPGFAFRDFVFGVVAGSAVWLASALHAWAIRFAVARERGREGHLVFLPSPSPATSFWRFIERKTK